MEIPINSRWRITTDSENWIVERRMRNAKQKDRQTGEIVPRWEQISFYRSLSSCMNALFERQLRMIPDSAKDLIRRVKCIRAEILTACRPFAESTTVKSRENDDVAA